MNSPPAVNLFTDLRAVLFDLDGTLIETHIDFARMKRKTLDLAARHGIESDSLAALDILAIVVAVRERLQVEQGSETAARWRADAFAMLQEIEIAECADPNPIPGAAELLRRLRMRGIAVGIVTRNCRVVAERLLATGDLHSDVLLTRDDVPRTKPDPAHLITALEKLGVGCRVSGVVKAGHPTPYTLHPTPYLMVGDHPMDVAAGRAAGMRTIGVLHGQPTERFHPCMPDLLVGRLSDLLPLVEAVG